MTPPAIDNEVSDRCSQRRNVCPPTMKANRITYAATHSRSTTSARRSGATLRSAVM